MKTDWFYSEKYFFTDESVKINWFNSGKYFFTYESVKRQITDSISENLTDSDLESNKRLQRLFKKNVCLIFLLLPNMYSLHLKGRDSRDCKKVLVKWRCVVAPMCLNPSGRGIHENVCAWPCVITRIKREVTREIKREMWSQQYVVHCQGTDASTQESRSKLELTLNQVVWNSRRAFGRISVDVMIHVFSWLHQQDFFRWKRFLFQTRETFSEHVLSY